MWQGLWVGRGCGLAGIVVGVGVWLGVCTDVIDK